MELEKTWYNNTNRDHNFVVYNDHKIYRLKAKPENHHHINRELSVGSINQNFIALPISYIKRIEYRADNINLRIFYGKNSEDEIRISQPKLREDIFLYLKSKTKHAKFEVDTPGLLKRIRKPLIALCVVLGIFLYVMSVVNGMNAGYEYELSGGRPGIGAIVLVMASLGAEANILIFSFLSLIAGIGIFVKGKDNSEIHRIVYR
ncbi:hypothetical protein KDU71_00045 [Carboxylicivirga sediminis]|uniref:Uncharacterized protein n=1 Tax=Carboxylicivirga sediminis TaxID=2006564 RepID=A0A941EYY5_9BACT|nr:hypothetical protein [Carboxylicivirga sediminis]MBR8533934.1 hypothetical protein [Carboxylicivirga sediminis]